MRCYNMTEEVTKTDEVKMRKYYKLFAYITSDDICIDIKEETAASLLPDYSEGNKHYYYFTKKVDAERFRDKLYDIYEMYEVTKQKLYTYGMMAVGIIFGIFTLAFLFV